jgi:lysophospholipase L1-like esterase
MSSKVYSQSGATQFALVAGERTAAQYNQSTLASAINDGGYVEIVNPGNYYILADNFSAASSTRVFIAPGVNFFIGDTPTALSSIASATVGPRTSMDDYNIAWLAGDSFALNNWSTVGATFNVINMEGIHEWANALAGRPLDIVNNIGQGGQTCLGFIAEQLPSILAARPGYVFLNIGTNDTFNAASLGGDQLGIDTARRIQYIVTTLVNAGIVPIWTTIAPRTSGYTAARLAECLDCNNRLRQWAADNRCGIFWDQWAPFLDSTSAQCQIKAGFAYDSPALHPNNYGAFVLGKKLAATLTNFVRPRQVFAFGNESQATATAQRSNVLINPNFTGTGGTVSANCTGTMPDSWAISWAVRTGGGSAAAAIVDITDPESGVVISKAIQVTVSGSAADNDEILITQASGFNSVISGGDLVRAEAIISIASPANLEQVRIRSQTNTTESTWWGAILQDTGAVSMAQAFTAHTKTRPIAVSGTGAASAARFDFRVRFNGAGTGTVATIYAPRISVNQP